MCVSEERDCQQKQNDGKASLPQPQSLCISCEFFPLFSTARYEKTHFPNEASYVKSKKEQNTYGKRREVTNKKIRILYGVSMATQPKEIPTSTQSKEDIPRSIEIKHFSITELEWFFFLGNFSMHCMWFTNNLRFGNSFICVHYLCHETMKNMRLMPIGFSLSDAYDIQHSIKQNNGQKWLPINYCAYGVRSKYWAICS